jgi:AhpD family alkylhydroperoxidase
MSTMSQRIDLTASPALFRAMRTLQAAVDGAGLDHSLLDLIKLRASQLNHCAYCIDMHWKDARARGETEQRLYGLMAWRESAHYYTDRELAALAWTEAVTFLHEGHAPDEVYQLARRHFDEGELCALTYALATINAWNRLCVPLRSRAGEYKPGQHAL